MDKPMKWHVKYNPANPSIYLLMKQNNKQKNIIEKKNKDNDKPNSEFLSLIIF